MLELPPGTYEITATGTSDELTHDTTVSITVIEPKLVITLGSNIIRPEIGQLNFNAPIVPVRGVAFDRLQPHVPGGQTDILVTIDGIDKSRNIDISLSFNPEIGTGGHDHLSAATLNNNARSAFGGFVGGGTPQISITGTTTNGEFSTVFRADNLVSAYSSAGGTILITAKAIVNGIELSDTERLTISVPNLLPLADGLTWDLVGGHVAAP